MNAENVRETPLSPPDGPPIAENDGTEPLDGLAPPPTGSRVSAKGLESRDDRWLPPLVALLVLLFVLVALQVWLPLDPVGRTDAAVHAGGGPGLATGSDAGGSTHDGGHTGAIESSDGHRANRSSPAASQGHGDDAADVDQTGADPGDRDTASGANAQAMAMSAESPPAPPQDQKPAMVELGFRSNLAATTPVQPVVPSDMTVPAAALNDAVNPGLASFFGQAGHGSRFVYVIDRSGSMSGGGAFAAARFELIRSLRTLRPHESYFVIFYDNDAMPMPARGLISATPENVDRTVEWLRGVSPGGGTDPTEAMVLALSRLKPDTIWLLSDGAFNVEVAETITRLNPGREIHINTIAFERRAGEAILKIIADENRGDYRFVDAP